MSRIVDETLRRWRERMPGVEQADLLDAEYHHRVRQMQRMLETVDLAMEDEGIPEDVRRRVVRTVVFGAPDETEALRRHEQHQRRAEEMARAPLFPLSQHART